MSAPAIVLRLELEASPQIIVDATSSSERRRLVDWLDHKPELLEIICAAEALRVVDDFGPPDLGDVRLLGGRHQHRSLNEVAAVDVRWFAMQLARLGADDWLRGPIEAYVRDALPDLWQRYVAWRREEQAA